MSGPQLEDGYTRIANELLEAFARTRFAGQERQVIDAVFRKTYGYGKKSDQISYGQIAQMTQIPRTKVIPLVKSLVLKMVLGSTNNGTRKPPTLWINKQYSQWLPSPKKGTSPNNRTIDSPNNGSLDSPNNGTHKRKHTKENLQKKSTSKLNGRCPHDEIVELYHQVCPHLPQVRDWTPSRQALLRARWNENKERQSVKWWHQFFISVAESDFLSGRAKDFKADLEWLIRPKNFPKVIEGRYSNTQQKKSRYFA